MDLRAVGEIRAGVNERFTPVHAGAHDHFLKVGYLHTGNKMRGGIATSHYFKTEVGDAHDVDVQADGSYIKTSKTAHGVSRLRGKLKAKVAAGGPGSGRRPYAVGTWVQHIPSGNTGIVVRSDESSTIAAHPIRGGPMQDKNENFKQLPDTYMYRSKL